MIQRDFLMLAPTLSTAEAAAFHLTLVRMNLGLPAGTLAEVNRIYKCIFQVPLAALFMPTQRDGLTGVMSY